MIHLGQGHSRKPECAKIESGQKYECLKVLEIEDYVEKAVDVEMALYVMYYATSLEKVVIDGVAHTGEDFYLLKRNLLEKLHIYDY